MIVEKLRERERSVKRLDCQLAIAPYSIADTDRAGFWRIRIGEQKDEADVLVYGTRDSNLQ